MFASKVAVWLGATAILATAGLAVAGPASAQPAPPPSVVGQQPSDSARLSMAITNNTTDTWTLSADTYGTDCKEDQAPLPTLAPGQTTYPAYDTSDDPYWKCGSNLNVTVVYDDPNVVYDNYQLSADFEAHVPAWGTNTTDGSAMAPADPAYSLTSSFTHGITSPGYTATYDLSDAS